LKETVGPLVPLLHLLQTPESARILADAFASPPTGAAGYRTRLWLAIALARSGLVSERLAPCANCLRFFVARSPRALTCSSRCRQQYHRATQDPEALRNREARAKSEWRARQRQRADAKHEPEATATSRTSRRPR
jgi:hypothetical protein